MLAQINSTIDNINENYNFDIESIDDMSVFVIIENKDLRIIARNIDQCIGDGDTKPVSLYWEKILGVGERTYTEVHLEQIVNILNNIKFNKVIGKFYLNGNVNNTIEALEEKNKFYKKFNSNIKVRKTYDDCSICFEPTMCKSKCEHYLCYPCWDKIDSYYCDECKEDDENICDDETCNHQRCPICRQLLLAHF